MTATSELLAAALRHQQEGRLQDAAGICEQILRSEPTQGDALQLLWRIAEQLAQPSLPVEHFRRAIAADPTKVAYYDCLGDLLSTLENHVEAAECYRQVVQRRPNSDVAHYNLGTSFDNQGKWSESIACYQRAVQLNPAHGAAYNNLGTALKAQGRLEEAIASGRRAAE